MNSLILYGVIVLAVIFTLLVIGFTVARLYKRATPEVALVRTGMGGARVIKDGGAMVYPAIHQITKVNMQSVIITVRRTGEDALIAEDDMRVDMEGDFSIRVGDDDNSIKRAAQTLGAKTFNLEQLREQIEGKVVDAARAVAASMPMKELHAKRAEFVQQVQQQLTEDLRTNGLVLETVSLTSLDQTNYDNLNPNNAFNARALTRLAEITSQASEQRAERQAAADIKIAEEQNRAAREKLRYEQELASESANQAVTIAQSNAKKEEAEARAREDIRRATEMAAQERQIAIAQKSREESEATAEANIAKAKAIESQEQVRTSELVAIAEREKRIAVLRAEEEAESRATDIRVKAAAERAAAEDRAAAIVAAAEAEAQSVKIRAQADEEAGLAKARARTAMVQAENEISSDVLGFNLNVERVKALPEVIRQMMAPAEKIDSIRLFYGNTGGMGAQGAANATSSPANLQDAILSVATNLPAAKAMGDMLGTHLTGGMSEVIESAMAPKAEEAPEASTDAEQD